MTYRLTRLEVGGQRYTPIRDAAGRILDRAAAAVLAATAGPVLPPRYCEVILADETAPRLGQPALRLAHFRTRGALPVELGDSGLRVGGVEAIWRVGAALHARVVLDGSVLAAVAWRALTEGLLSGVCPAVDLGDPAAPEFVAVHLSPLEDCCLTGARVLRSWEEPTSSPVAP
jgi:hypothetical protein